MRLFALRSLPKWCPGAAFLAALIVFPGWFRVLAQEAKPATPPAAAEAKDKDKTADKEPPLPADAHVAQSIQLDGKTLNYTVTVGTLPVFDKDGKKSGEVVFTAYTVEGEDRPVTFALNGGPGAASVYLNFGAIGPKHIEFGERGRQPVRSGDADRQSGHVAGLHRPGVHRSDRHRLQPVAGLGGRDEEAVLQHRHRHSLPLAHHLRLAGEERTAELAEIPGGRELRRLSRPAHHALPAVAARRGDERRGAGVAVPESDAGRERRRLADSVDDDAAVDYRGAPRARAQADAGGDGAGDCVHARRVCHRPAEGPLRPGGDARGSSNA